MRRRATRAVHHLAIRRANGHNAGMTQPRRLWRFARGLAFASVLAALAGPLSCGGSSSTAPIPVPTVYHDRQIDPDWSIPGLLAYIDHGIVCETAAGVVTLDSTKAGIWTWNPVTDARQRVTSFGVAPAFSPDGSRIAFTSPFKGQVYVADGTGAHAITPLGAATDYFWPRWSPDGLSLCFSKPDGDSAGVWVSASDGSGRRLIASPGFGADWWPIGSDSIAYSTIATASTGSTVYIQSVSSGQRRVLFTDLAGTVDHLRWSRDGSKLVFQELVPGVRIPNIRVVSPAVSTTITTITPGVAPTWSPDGASIAFEHQDTYQPGIIWNTIWVVNVSTSAQTQVTFHWPDHCDATAAIVSSATGLEARLR